MCGIVGVIGAFEGASVRKALQTIEHRGPDAEGLWLCDLAKESVSADLTEGVYRDHLLFGHRRLRIIDLSDEANQPMEYGDLVLIYNGEIYNYIELREELEGLGYRFGTESDSEVLLKAYAEWGEDCVHRFNGMWAFAIFDRRRRRCFLSRDRLGVKPLYYWQEGGSFYFASEIKALLALGVAPVANREEILRYLVYGVQESAKETMFRNVFRLPPGHNAVYDIASRGFSKKKYFDLREVTGDHHSGKETEEGYISEIRENVERSVRFRLRSDVPIGMALSGGVDSNIVVYSAHRHNRQMHTFSSVYTEDESINETANIRTTLDRLELQGHFVTVTKADIFRSIESIVWHMDEPFDTLGILAQNRVYALMRQEGVKVSLDGQGADETFGGYPTYIPVYMREKLTDPRELGSLFKCGYLTSSNLKMVAMSLSPKLTEKLYFFKRAKKIFRQAPPFLSGRREGMFELADLNRKLVYDTMEYLPVLLRYVDRNSMQFSIESRGIFLDYRLVIDALRIPSTDKIKHCFTKYILRKSFEDVVPPSIIWDRRKLGFPVPQKGWMADAEVGAFFDAYLRESRILEEMGVELRQERTNDIYWRLVNVAIWEKVFEVGMDQ